MNFTIIHTFCLMALMPLGVLRAQETIQETISDKERAGELRYLELVFSPSVFADDEFPKCDFLKPARAKQLLGDYTLSSEFYDAHQQRVDMPTDVGRYGAIVTVTGANGFRLTRYRTLYRIPRALSWWTRPVDGSLKLPREFGIEADIAERQGRQIITTLLISAQRDAQRSHGLAVLLAGLSETPADAPPATRFSDASAKDREWWLRLSRKRNGNEQRFTSGIPTPRKIEGEPARVLRSGTLAEAGMKPDTVERIDAVLSRWADDTDEPFIACVARRGVIVYHKAFGAYDGEPTTIETKNAVASITKALSGSLAMMFVDRGLLQLDDPVEKFLPEFATADVAKSATIHHLFTHTAGMESHYGDGLVDLEQIYGGQTYPLLEVGVRHQYNGDSLGIGTRVLEQISGMTLPQLYKTCLFDPLGCDSIEATNSSWDARSTALDLARVGQMLANRGAYGDKRFFSEETFQQMIPQRLNNLLGNSTQIEWGIGLTWFRNEGLSDRVIGHGSATASTLRVDLSNDLVVTMTRGGAGRNFGKYHPQFIRAVADSLAPPLLHPLFADHMVLQRDKKVPIWGWSHPGTTVRVSINGQTAITTTDDSGKWVAQLGPFSAGGPHTLTVDGHESIAIQDVLVGDVWICSGQSNMEWPVRASNDAQQEIADAEHASIRLFTVPKRISTSPQELVDGSWQACNRSTVPNFSAVGYFFGRQLNEKLDVPMGLINTSWGGTVAEAWTSGESLESMDDFRRAVADVRKTADEEATGQVSLVERVADWWNKNDQGSNNNLAWSQDSFDDTSWEAMKLPAHWEQAGLAELAQFDGVVWFRTAFDLPGSWSGKEIVLSLGPIDDVDTTWVNGHSVGSMLVWDAARSYQVSAEHLKPENNVVAIRVYDNDGPGGIYGKPNQMAVRLAEDPQQRISLAGSWRYKIGPAKNKLSPFPQPMGQNPNVVTVLYNGMLAPLAPFGIKGAIWYQGESNAGRPYQYRRLLPTMIKDWRTSFEQGDFPFLVVQLANFMQQQQQPVESGWAELREAQLLTAAGDPNVGLAVTTDIGDANDIHPRNKQEVGRRLALAALRVAYGEDVVHAGPTFKELVIEGSNLRVIFDNVGGGLEARGDRLKGFAIAGSDKNFAWADAVIEDDAVVLSSDEVDEPKFVRYGWANNPLGNLYNKAGLPASPFRTDGRQRP